MYKDKFVLSVIYNGKPVKETGPFNNKQVALPFGSEYKIRLKNKHSKACTARVFIDGKQVSMLGDFIIQAYGTLDLERFVDSSLSEGKKFKFVELTHPDVDDPTSYENGIIKVEFRLSKEDVLFIDKVCKEYIYDPSDFISYDIYYTNLYNVTNYSSNSISNSRTNYSTEPGATIEGGTSNQQFGYSSLNVIEIPTVLQLKLVGIKSTDIYVKNYCNKCGHKVNKADNYCSKCGAKI